MEEVVFLECGSKEWLEVGKLLSSYEKLLAVEMHKCDSNDEFCSGVSKSITLHDIILMDCCTTDKGVQDLIKMPQLRQLRLIASNDSKAFANKFTIHGFKKVLSNLGGLPKL